MDPAEVQARIRLSALLFRTAMPAFAKALAAAAQPPPRPEEKETLLARLERGAWELPTALLFDADAAGWEDKTLQSPAVRALLADAVDERVRARRG